MPVIYGSAMLTISALSAENGSGGCSLQPAAGTFVDVNAGPLRIRFFQEPPPYWHKVYGDDKYQHDGYGTKPLRTRAWTLQERLLSIRSIHYADGILLWECNSAKGSSIVPWGHHDPPDDFVPWPVLESEHESTASDGPMALRAEWFGILEDYSSRFMTKEMDKLPALSGVAAKFSAKFKGDEYHAGLFRRHLPAALLWRSLGSDSNQSMREADLSVRKYSAFQPRRPMQYRAPSWSWAALDCAISYDSQRLDNSAGPRPSVGAPLRRGALQVLDVQTRQTSSNPFGAVKMSRLNVLGRTAAVRLHWDSQGHVQSDGGWRLLTTIDGTAAGVVYPDIINELQFTRMLTCLEIRDEPFWTETILSESVFGTTCDTEEKWEDMDLVVALALSPVPGQEGVYQRKGLIRWLRRRLFSHAEQIQLTIV